MTLSASKSHSAQRRIKSSAVVRNAGLHLVAPTPLLSVFVAAAAPSEFVASVDCTLFVRVAPEFCVPVPLSSADPSDESPVADACALTNPSDAAVTTTPSTTTAEPPCDTVCVVEASGMTQAPLASREPVMTLLPIVRTVCSLSTLTRPLAPAVRVAPSNSTAEPPAEAVCVVVMSGMIQAPFESCVHCTILLPTVMIVVCTLMRVTPPWFDWPDPGCPAPAPLPEPELSCNPLLFSDPEPSCEPPLFPEPSSEPWPFDPPDPPEVFPLPPFEPEPSCWPDVDSPSPDPDPPPPP